MTGAAQENASQSFTTTPVHRGVFLGLQRQGNAGAESGTSCQTRPEAMSQFSRNRTHMALQSSKVTSGVQQLKAATGSYLEPGDPF